ncbi:hypothetical protein BDK51DRAFT_32968 [Blyttiomyces helicus]|uniref:PARP catalytic domain-containing protein n=1 Tax=Blyttiomyces helicus TaxID=388810 RepID=A0A4P9WFP9_9FUNG|nr:hypothetical protein BDK51DRAFT_32968 [Blyttiomyces helicus]|eukprot:RKO90593.1 hypothetical protein BDK51DRAFT_32968 [Blyttiomyces helicus]
MVAANTHLTSLQSFSAPSATLAAPGGLGFAQRTHESSLRQRSCIVKQLTHTAAAVSHLLHLKRELLPTPRSSEVTRRKPFVVMAKKPLPEKEEEPPPVNVKKRTRSDASGGKPNKRAKVEGGLKSAVGGALLTSASERCVERVVVQAGIVQPTIQQLLASKPAWLPHAHLDPDHHHDFVSACPTTTPKLYRGGVVYTPPFGWLRLAIKVRGKYNDDAWLGRPAPPGRDRRIRSSPGEWWVTFHGTSVDGARGIVERGYDPACLRTQGFYSSSRIEVALRVDPRTVKGDEFGVFVAERTEAIRPYALLLRRIA